MNWFIGEKLVSYKIHYLCFRLSTCNFIVTEWYCKLCAILDNNECLKVFIQLKSKFDNDIARIFHLCVLIDGFEKCFIAIEYQKLIGN